MIVSPSGWFAGCCSGWCLPQVWSNSRLAVRRGGASQVRVSAFLILVNQDFIFINSLVFTVPTALTYHYETQCIPTPLAWFAHQLPVWWQKLSVIGTFVIEIPVPLLFFSPVRRLRLGSFYLQVGGNPGVLSKNVTWQMCSCQLSLHFGFILQVLLQVLIILSGNYNFFNLLTLTLCLSLLDDEHIHFWLRKRPISSESGMNKKTKTQPFFVFLSVLWPASVSANVPFIHVSFQALLLGRGSVTCWSWWSGLSWLWEQLFASAWSWIWLKWPSPTGQVCVYAVI